MPPGLTIIRTTVDHSSSSERPSYGYGSKKTPSNRARCADQFTSSQRDAMISTPGRVRQPLSSIHPRTVRCASTITCCSTPWCWMASSIRPSPKPTFKTAPCDRHSRSADASMSGRSKSGITYHSRPSRIVRRFPAASFQIRSSKSGRDRLTSPRTTWRSKARRAKNASRSSRLGMNFVCHG